MKFIVMRASEYDFKKKPCDEAVKENINGTSHWVVEFQNLQQLEEFMDKYGKIVLAPDVWGRYVDNVRTLIIYDDYIE